MQRSTGVTVIAILSLIGSTLTFGIGIVLALVMTRGPLPRSNDFPGSPVFFKIVLVGVVLMYLLPSGWGIASGIGLLRLKNWARVSMIVFSVLLIVMGVFSVLPSLFPISSISNKPADASAMAAVRVFMGVFSLALAGIGIWWLVFFTRPKVREQFLSAPVVLSGEPVTSVGMLRRRPLSITIIAWWLLAGCLFIPLNLWLHSPAILFTKVVTSRPAAATYYLVIGALHLYLGIGLLRLRPTARTAGIAYFVFGFVNAAVFYFAPGGHARMLAFLELLQSVYPWMRSWQNPALQAQLAPYLIVGAVVGLVSLLVPLYFLITRRQAFAPGLPGSMGAINQI